MSIKEDLVAYAGSLGFEKTGVTSADPLERQESFFLQWLEEGRAGEMHYLEREPRRRARPADLLPGARSVIALAMRYGSEEAGSAVPEGRVARYARGADYHRRIRKRLDAFVRYAQALSPQAAFRTFVDTGPLLERGIAQRAGVGFVGKNTMLIARGLGSWVFLASVLTTLELPADAPDARSCGQCRLCIDACPTQAITAPYELDPRRCIAYLTIEADGAMDKELRGKTDGWIFGCDRCQEVCPHNAKGGSASMPDFAPGVQKPGPTLAEILSLQTDEAFRARFAGTAFLRAGRSGMLRNACVAAAHLERSDLLPLLETLRSRDASALVREHAAWAVQELQKA